MSDSPKEFVPWQEQYEALMNQLGFSTKDTHSYNRRNHPRFNFKRAKSPILIDIGNLTCALYDISAGGISFNCLQPLTKGMLVKLRINGRLNVMVQLMNILVVSEDSMKEDNWFRHGAKFVSEEEGYRCVVFVLQSFAAIMQSSILQ